MDGDSELQKASSNGTWMYLSESFAMYHNMYFKAAYTLFKVQLN